VAGGRIAADETRRAALGLVAELLDRLRDPAVRDLEVRQGDLRVRVSKDGAAAAPAAEPATEPAAEPGVRPAQPPKPAANAVTAPLTGIFYRSGSPQAPAFVQVGSVISPGDVIGLIEAMKLFNEVRSAVAGRVRRIVAENGQLVRAHQPLLELE
jgi:acetyl-CoA carboxylase biotin carboxyl carrier protein